MFDATYCLASMTRTVRSPGILEISQFYFLEIFSLVDVNGLKRISSSMEQFLSSSVVCNYLTKGYPPARFAGHPLPKLFY